MTRPTADRKYLGQTTKEWRQLRNRCLTLLALVFGLAVLLQSPQGEAIASSAPTASNSPLAAVKVAKGDLNAAEQGEATQAETRCLQRLGYTTTAKTSANDRILCQREGTAAALASRAEWAANKAENGDCEARGLITAEDYSCVGKPFYKGSKKGSKAVQEDQAGWSCTTMGNHVCGPKSGAPAGCYSNGQLVIPWTNYTNPKADPLYGQLTAPC